MASNLPWSQIKSRLSAFEKEDLLNLIRDLYQLNSDNKVMLATRLAATSSDGLADDLAEPYKRAIRREFNPDRGLPRLNIGAARKALSSFKKASASLEAVIDMLIYYVEQGVICTNQYGDIHEQFYSSLESAFEEALSRQPVRCVPRRLSQRLVSEGIPNISGATGVSRIYTSA
jgi:hypothetical protein